jgi:hypothetical protein
MIAAMSAAESVIEHLRRRGLRLEYATFGWNVVGSVLVLAAVSVRSVALARVRSRFAIPELVPEGPRGDMRGWSRRSAAMWQWQPDEELFE